MAKTQEQKNIKTQEQKKSPSKSSKKKVSRKSPQTMEELLACTGYRLHGFKKRELVEGKIVSLSVKEILVDVGGKTEGTVARKELPLLKDSFSTLKIGEKITCRILLPESEKGRPLLSLREAVTSKKWQILDDKTKREEELEVLAKRVARGGILVDWQNLRGFIPQSQLDPQFASDVRSLLGRKIKVRVLEVNQSKNRLVLSQRAVTQKQKVEELKKILKQIKIGQVLRVEISGIVPFGLFCQTEGLEGLIHISEISWERVENPGDFFKVGDKVKTKVLGIDEREGKLNLSIKKLTADPWTDIEKKYKKEQIVKGKVARVSPFGTFVTFKKGIEGLIHVSKIPPGVEFKQGEKIECVIEDIDKDARKISLSYLPKEKPVGYK